MAAKTGKSRQSLRSTAVLAAKSLREVRTMMSFLGQVRFDGKIYKWVGRFGLSVHRIGDEKYGTVSPL
jgi:transposase-like protein